MATKANKAEQNPQEAPLPTHGGVYEFDPSTKVMRAVEGGPSAQESAPEPAQTPSATTGDAA